MLGQTYTCHIAIVNGDNAVLVAAQDRTGHQATLGTTVSSGDPPAPTSVTSSPHRLLVFEGERREIQVDDERAHPVSGGTWDIDQPTVAEILVQDGRTYLHALSAGSATLTLTLAGLSDQMLVDVAAAGTELPAGTTLWELTREIPTIR